MKKIKQLLVFLLLVSCTLTYASFIEHEEIHADGYDCPNGHSGSVDSISIAPTCTEEGTALCTCNVAGCIYNSSQYRVMIPRVDHDFSRSAGRTEPTCTEAGSETLVCSYGCGTTNTVTLNALGHDYVTTTKKATCTETGTQKSVCSRCNDTKTTTLKALGHDWEEEHKDPTCTEEGYDKKTCKRCDEVEETKIPALGHKISGEKTVKEPTCTEDGLKTSECSVCGEKFEEKIPALGHKYPDDWEASYFSAGLETKTCEMGDDVIEQEIPQKDPTPLVVGGGGVAVAAGAGLFIMNGLKSG